MTAPSPEAFLAAPSTDEDDLEPVALPSLDLSPGHLMALPPSPLESIADSLRQLVALTEARDSDAAGEEIRLLGEAYDDLEAKHRSLFDLLAEVEKIVKPSTSKLANSVRDAINAWRNPDVPAEDEMAAQDPIPGVDDPATPVAVPGASPCPAADAPIEEWVAYARGVLGPDTDADLNRMNRSQIRTLLGIPQPVAG